LSAQWRAQGLAPSLECWLDSNEIPGSCYHGLLDPALLWLHDYPDELAGPPADYIQASKRRRTRRRGLLSGAVAVLALLALVASIAFVVVSQARNTAVQQRDQAIYNQVFAEALQFGTSNTPLAAQLNLAAYRMQPTQDLASRLLNTENTPLSPSLERPQQRRCGRV
jgi:hypothetical protein